MNAYERLRTSNKRSWKSINIYERLTSLNVY